MGRELHFGEALHALAQAPQSGAYPAAPIPVAAEAKLLRFVELLAKWNKVFNLTAITDPARMTTHHLLDSLAVAAPIDVIVAGKERPRLLDVGSGAGLPGIPLAIARPSWSITMLDSNGKKTAFIQQAAGELELPNVRVVTCRAEMHSGRYDLILSRAFSTLRDFVQKTERLLVSGGAWAAMKGVMPSAEISDLPANVICAEVIPLHVPGLDAERNLVILRRAA
jgi:16S rRNA (guanine527-N7)-methyltransferase